MIIAIVSILLIGIVLLILEFFLFPGTTFVGVGGIIFMIIGIVLCYQNYGNFYGNISLLSSLIITVMLFFVGFNRLKSSDYALTRELKGKVNELKDLKVKEGDEGIAISDLKPIGKGKFFKEKMEVTSINDFIERNSRIKIVQITNSKILVTKIN